MEVFVVKSLTSVLIIVLMASGVVPDKLSTDNKNGYSGRVHGTKNNTKDECNPEVGTGIRRNLIIRVYPNPDQQCYTQFFVPQQGQVQGQGRPPEGLRGQNYPKIKYICQPPDHQPQEATYYATMFDENLGIAVFSAYKLTQANFPENPATVGFCPTPGIQRQGSDDLYQEHNSLHGTKYEKGHLAPAHTFSQDQERYASTFTYTNAVPQWQSFNRGAWKTFEDGIREYAEGCTQAHDHGTLYLLTGTSFSRYDPDNWPVANQVQIDLLDQQIVIPASMWTAGCCVRPNNQDTTSFAVIGNNLQNEGENAEWSPGKSKSDEDLSKTQEVTVDDLQTFLRNDAIRNGFTNGGQAQAPNVDLFPGNQNCLINP